MHYIVFDCRKYVAALFYVSFYIINILAVHVKETYLD